MIAEILALIKPWNLGRDVELPSDRRDEVAAQGEIASVALVPESHFHRVLSFEQRRAERSDRRFVLVQLHLGDARSAGVLGQGIAKAVSSALRETDFCGWYRQDAVVGVLCSEVGCGDVKDVLNVLHTKLSAAVRSELAPEQTQGITVSFHVLPDEKEAAQRTPAAHSGVPANLQPV